MTIYVLQGISGYGSPPEYLSWNVRAFTDEARATDVRDRLNAWSVTRETHPSLPETKRRMIDDPRPDPDLDPDPLLPGGMTSLEYRVRPLELVGVPTWEV